MLQLGSNIKIYLRLGYTDMRKGINGLSELAKLINKEVYQSGGLFVFRGKTSDKIKILWWDGNGFCLFYKSLDKGKFVWPQTKDSSNLGITSVQLSMLLEGIDWRTPKWSKAPEYVG